MADNKSIAGEDAQLNAAKEKAKQDADASSRNVNETDENGNEIPFKKIEQWHEPIDPAALLTEIAATIKRFIVCSNETANAAALWVAMTWFMDSVQVAPLAVITAPEKRCGKTQCLDIMSRMSHRPLTASNITPAALFRSVDAWKPTLFIDEADAFLKENEELRGLINCGHTRTSAYIVRTVGKEFTPKHFNVWGAKAISGIGKLADTLMDRAIVLELKRKKPDDPVERLRHADPDLWITITRKLRRFANDCADAIKRARPHLPDELNDRAQDNWEPLLQIADTAGGVWPRLARIAATTLSGDGRQSLSVGVELLCDIEEIFRKIPGSKISTVNLIAELTKNGEKRWQKFHFGEPISPRQLAKHLGSYGISKGSKRIGAANAKGYEKADFDDAFQRYVFPLAEKEEIPVTQSQGNGNAGLSVTDTLPVTGASVTGNAAVTPKSSIHAGCDRVTGKDLNIDNPTVTEVV